MKLSSRVFALIACGVGATALALAQAPMPLNIKLGLWETSMSMEMAAPRGGERMTAEQQQVAAMMRGRGAAMMPAVKICMTREKLAENRLTQEREGTTCKSTPVSSTATTLDLKQVCTGNDPSTSTIHIETENPTTMKTVVQPTSGRGAGMTITMNSKWLQTDCGNVK